MMRVCPVCDLALGSRRTCPNYWCNRADRGFDVVWAVAAHQGEMRRAIAALKYRGQTARAEQLGAALAGYLLRRAPAFDDVGLIVAVPPSRAPDHVGLVLDAVRRRTGHLWPIAAGAVAKRAPTPPMVDAPSAEVRRLWAASDLRQALVVTEPAVVRSRRVLVVDDVFTDGSTLREMARALRAAGASAVSGLVLARQPLGALVP